MAKIAHPRITVVTPSFNSARYVEACLRSVARQGYAAVDQLIVDAGSTDGTGAIVAKYPHARFVVIPRCSQSEALNWGFANAEGTVLCWLNSDDILLPGALDHVGAAARSLPARWFHYGNLLYIDPAGRLLSRRIVQPLVVHAIRNFTMYVPTSGSFLSRTVADDGIFLRGDLHYLMDREFLLELGARGYSITRTHRLLSGFRTHPDQKSFAGANEPERAAERSAINQRHGGIWLRGRRIAPWSPTLMRLSHLFVGAGARLGTAVGKAPLWRPGSRAVEAWLSATEAG